jgi:hypothetical protein
MATKKGCRKPQPASDSVDSSREAAQKIEPTAPAVGGVQAGKPRRGGRKGRRRDSPPGFAPARPGRRPGPTQFSARFDTVTQPPDNPYLCAPATLPRFTGRGKNPSSAGYQFPRRAAIPEFHSYDVRLNRVRGTRVEGNPSKQPVLSHIRGLFVFGTSFSQINEKGVGSARKMIYLGWHKARLPGAEVRCRA